MHHYRMGSVARAISYVAAAAIGHAESQFQRLTAILGGEIAARAEQARGRRTDPDTYDLDFTRFAGGGCGARGPGARRRRGRLGGGSGMVDRLPLAAATVSPGAACHNASSLGADHHHHADRHAGRSPCRSSPARALTGSYCLVMCWTRQSASIVGMPGLRQQKDSSMAPTAASSGPATRARAQPRSCPASPCRSLLSAADRGHTEKGAEIGC
jgi:hypothetical protein